MSNERQVPFGWKIKLGDFCELLPATAELRHKFAIPGGISRPSDSSRTRASSMSCSCSAASLRVRVRFAAIERAISSISQARFSSRCARYAIC